MKYAVLMPLGGADEPQEALAGRTPLAAAAMPRTAAIAEAGRVGLARTFDGDPWPGAGLAGLLGAEPSGEAGGLALDPGPVGEGALRAVGAGLDIPDNAWVYTLGWVSTATADGAPSAADAAVIAEWDESTLTPDESSALWADIAAAWRAEDPDGPLSVERAGDAWVLVDRRLDHAGVSSHAPWRVIGEAWRNVEPGGGHAESALALRRFMHVGSGVLAVHDINASRLERGLPLLTMPWPWGPAHPPRWRTFLARYGLRGVMVTDDALAAAAAGAAGCPVAPLPAGAGEADLGAAAVDALGGHDLVFVAAGAPRRASERGDAAAKAAALEAFDAAIVGPIAERLQGFGDPEADADARGWRILVLPDTLWPTGASEPDAAEVPILMAGAWIRSVVRRGLAEEAAADSDLRIASPGALLEFFLLGGLARAKAVGRRREDAGTLWEMDA